MKTVCVIVLGLTLCATALAQTTTNTDCSSQKTGNATTTNCQSTTTPPPTPPPTSDARYQTGQQIGQGIGNLGNALVFRIRSNSEMKKAKKNCAERPGFEHGYKFSDGEIALCENGVPTPEIMALQDYCKMYPDTVGPTVPDGPYTCTGNLPVHVSAK
jgi:hypothetical protein